VFSNSTHDTSNGLGGAVLVGRGTIVNIDNCFFKDNESGYGGAIYNLGFLQLETTKFQNNFAAQGPQGIQGKDIFFAASYSPLLPTISICEFSPVTNAIASAVTNPTSIPEISGSGTPGIVSINGGQVNFINTNPPAVSADPTCPTCTDPAQSLADAGENKEICLGEIAVLGGAVNSDYTYSWSPVDGLSDPNIANPVANPSTTTLYVLSVTDNICGFVSTDEVWVSIIELEAIAGSDQVICPGVGEEIGVVGNPDHYYSWSPATGLSNPNIANPIANPYQTTTYTLMVSSIDCEVVVTDEVTVSVSNSNITFPENEEICSGESVQLTASGAQDYLWTDPGMSLSCIDCANPVASPDITTSYDIIAIDDNGCEVTETVTVVVLPGANLAVTMSQGQPMCIGQEIVLTASGADSYLWSPTDGLTCPSCEVTTLTVTGNMIYTVTGFGNGCSAQASVAIEVPEETNIDFTYDIDGCSVTVTPTVTGLSQYIWNMGDGTTYYDSTPVTHTYPNNGTYFITLEVVGVCGEPIPSDETIQISDCDCTTQTTGGG